MTAEFIRTFNDFEDCKIFEIADMEDRVFAFQAKTHKEMQHWIKVLNTVRTAALEKKQAEEQRKIEEATPERIRIYDNDGEDGLRSKICLELEEIYPATADPPFEIKEHIKLATCIVQYIKETIPEVQQIGTQPARYDVLALVLTAANEFITNRFGSLFFSEENDGLSTLLDAANLGDLHALIDWISKYQATLRSIRCPVSSATSHSTNQVKLSTTFLTPKNCDVFKVLPQLCKLYVHGGSTGSKGGAASHLYEHLMKVWKTVENNLEEMLQRHNNGTFYTESPIQMWVAINQHISLATSTNSPILHVMIAEKVVTSLMTVFSEIITYITNLDTSQRTELKEIELEYISALANDTALHIEDVIELIENFTIPEIREKIDEIFDPLTTMLFQCGQICLKRLAGLVMSDVQSLLDQVFEEEWIEGNQMHVATATISDYMKDFQEFLVPFWADKFVMTILEEVILSYTRTLLFRKDKKKSVTITVTTESHTPTTPSASSSAMNMFSSFFQKTKQTITQTITTQIPSHVPVDEESLGRLAQDVNILNAFFSQKAGQEVATEFLQLINEVSLMLFVDLQGLINHIALRSNEYPSAAQAIYQVVVSVMKLRYEQFTKSEIDYLTVQVQDVLQAAPEDAQQREQAGIVEGRLGLLYLDVIPKDNQNPHPNHHQKLTLAQRMKVMANIPLFGAAAKTIVGEEEEEEIDKLDDHTHANHAISTDDYEVNEQLLSEVIEVLEKDDENEMELDHQFARQKALEEAEIALRQAKIMNYDGYLEKKSPAHNLWQVKKKIIVFTLQNALICLLFFFFFSK
jgi:hypothetical protein